jgi:hypothetical protein
MMETRSFPDTRYLYKSCFNADFRPLGAKSVHFVPIGSNSFWTRGAERAHFDQQPLEAHAMIAACVEAYALTRDAGWHRAARRCFDWFLDRNDLGQPLYDASTGGCRDALHQDRLNQNQGAESTLAFHLSRAEMTRAEAVLYGESQRLSAN